MKRIIAKEFLLLVGCVVVVLLVALFGWARNAWLNHRIDSIGPQLETQVRTLDSLSTTVNPKEYRLIDLFDSASVRGIRRFYFDLPEICNGLDPLSPFSRVYTCALVDAAQRTGHITTDLEKRVRNPRVRFSTLADLAKAVRNKYPGSYNDLDDRVLALKLVERYPLAFPNLRDSATAANGRHEVNSGPWTKYSEDNPFTDAWRYKLQPVAEDDSDRSALLKSLNSGSFRIPLQELADSMDAARPMPLPPASFNLALTIQQEEQPHSELRRAFDHLSSHGVLTCTFEEVLYTLQRKPVPPTQVALAAHEKQKAVVDGLRNDENNIRASLWSEAKQLAIVKWAAIILLLLVYPLRLLVLGTRWAFRTLRA